jgi:hypothetical protein
VHSNILTEIAKYFRVFPRLCGFYAIKTAKKRAKAKFGPSKFQKNENKRKKFKIFSKHKPLF